MSHYHDFRDRCDMHNNEGGVIFVCRFVYFVQIDRDHLHKSIPAFAYFPQDQYDYEIRF